MSEVKISGRIEVCKRCGTKPEKEKDIYKEWRYPDIEYCVKNPEQNPWEQKLTGREWPRYKYYCPHCGYGNPPLAIHREPTEEERALSLNFRRNEHTALREWNAINLPEREDVFVRTLSLIVTSNEKLCQLLEKLTQRC